MRDVLAGFAVEQNAFHAHGTLERLHRSCEVSLSCGKGDQQLPPVAKEPRLVLVVRFNSVELVQHRHRLVVPCKGLVETLFRKLLVALCVLLVVVPLLLVLLLVLVLLVEPLFRKLLVALVLVLVVVKLLLVPLLVLLLVVPLVLVLLVVKWCICEVVHLCICACVHLYTCAFVRLCIPLLLLPLVLLPLVLVLVLVLFGVQSPLGAIRVALPAHSRCHFRLGDTTARHGGRLLQPVDRSFEQTRAQDQLIEPRLECIVCPNAHARLALGGDVTRVPGRT